MPFDLLSAVTAFLSAGFAAHFTVAAIAFLVIVSVVSASQEECVDTPRSLLLRDFEFISLSILSTDHQSLSVSIILGNTGSQY